MTARWRTLALAATSLALGACAGGQPVQGRPSGREGWVVHAFHDLRFEAPASWRATADERRLRLEAPGGGARLEVSAPDAPFADERACLAAADAKLAERQGGLERARRHPTRLAGRSAQLLEGDQGGWHLWALAACDGGAQVRIFFTAATPASAEALETWRALLQSARIGGEA